MNRLSRQIVVAFAILMGACAGGPKTKELPLVPPHRNGTVTFEPIVFALSAAEKVKDDGLKLSLLDRIAELCAKTGLKREGLAILSYATQLFQRRNNRYQYEELGIAFAKRYIELGSPQAAERLLNQGLDHAESLDEEVRKKFVFEEIILTGLSGGEEFVPLLKKTVDSVLVLDDATLKTDLLMESAAKFFDAGRLKDSSDLIQLTLSQIGSLEDPWNKAEIFSRLGVLYRKQKNETRVKEYVRKAMSSLDAGMKSRVSEQDGMKIAAVATNLFRISFADEGLKALDRIPQPWTAAETLEKFGLDSLEAGDTSKYEYYVDRAFETAAAIPDDAKRLSTLFLLDSVLVEKGHAYDTMAHFPLREAELFALGNLPGWDDLAYRLSRLYLLTGDLDSGLRVVRRIRDPYNRVAALVSSARDAIRDGKVGDGQSLLEESLNLISGVDRSRDRLFREISSVYLELDEPIRALHAASAITDAYPLGAAISDIVKHYLSSGRPMDEEAKVLFRRLAGT